MIEIYEISEMLNYADEFKAIIFDMDDTLYSEKDYVRSGYCKISEVFPEIKSFELWEAFKEGKPAIDYVLEKHNMPDKKKECLDIYRNQIPDINVYDGVYEMLSCMKNKNIKLGMITDGRPEGQHNKIIALKLEKYFDKIIITDELGGIEFRKPNPVSFELMCDFFGFDYSEMCYVGDNINKDFISPEKLGMKCFWLKNKDGLYVKD